jgi:hypothetical protein
MKHITKHCWRFNRHRLLTDGCFMSFLLRRALGTVKDPGRARAILKLLPRDGHFIEVGTYKGRNALSVLQQRPHASAVLVDPYVTYDDGDVTGMKWKDCKSRFPQRVFDKVYEGLKKRLSVRSNVTLLRLPSVDAATCYGGPKADVLFIDGNHRYESVKADILAWLPHVKLGGWIGGHDYHENWYGVRNAVDEIFKDVEFGEDKTWWYRTTA